MQLLQVNHLVFSYLTVQRNMEEFNITIQMQILSNNTIERSRNKNGI